MDEAAMPIVDRVIMPGVWWWFRQNNLWPSTWGLAAEFEQRLLWRPFKIMLLFSPASRLEFIFPETFHAIVMSDASMLDEGKISHREFIAILLHEIGHIVNEPDDCTQYFPDNEPREFWADDFARASGFEAELLSSWDKLSAILPTTFTEGHMAKRVERILANVTPLLRKSP